MSTINTTREPSKSSIDRPADAENMTWLRRSAAIALLLTGLLHLVLVPEYLEEASRIGWSFVVGGLVSVAVAAWLWLREDDRAWWLATLLGAGMAVAFILSRTVGLFGFQEAEWELSGSVSVLLELGIVGAFVWDHFAPARAS